MNAEPDDATDVTAVSEVTEEPAGGMNLARRLLVETVIGLGLAGILVMVAWASSTAIRFVYGGY